MNLCPFIIAIPVILGGLALSAATSQNILAGNEEAGFGYLPLFLALVLVAAGLIVCYRHRHEGSDDDKNHH